jgi:hypothetical protein
MADDDYEHASFDFNHYPAFVESLMEHGVSNEDAIGYADTFYEMNEGLYDDLIDQDEYNVLFYALYDELVEDYDYDMHEDYGEKAS